MGTSVGQIDLDLVLQSSAFKSQLNSAVQSATSGINNVGKSANGVTSIFKRMGRALVAAFAVQKIVSFASSCLELGSNLTEVQNVVDVTFGSMADKVNEFAQSAMTTAGMSETMAKKYVGTFGAMAKSFGFSTDQALSMSESLTQLSGDVSSFYNIGQDEAYTKLKSVFTGETESLKELGVVMTQSALDQYALANGYGKTTQKMTEQEKVALRYAFVQSQLSAASGDFIRTSGSWANQVRVLSLQFDALRASIGQGLIAVLTPVIRGLNLLLAKINVVAKAFSSLMQKIFGRVDSGSSGTSTAASQIADSAGTVAQAEDSVANAAQAAASGTSKAASNTKKAAKSTEKAVKVVKSLLGFDEINKLSEETEDTPSSTATDTPVVDTTTPVSSGALNAAADAVSDLSDGLSTANEFGNKLKKTLAPLINVVKQLAESFRSGFQSALGNTLENLGKIKDNIISIGKSLLDIFTDPNVTGAISNYANSWMTALGQVVGSIINVGVALVENLTAGIADSLEENKAFIKEKIASIFNIQAEVVKLGGNLVETLGEIISTALTNDAAESITSSIFSTLSIAFLSAWEMLDKIALDVGHILADPVIENKDKIIEAIDSTLQPIATLFDGFKENVRFAAETLGQLYDEHIHPFFQSIADGVSDSFGKWLDVYNTYIAPMLQRLADKVTEVWEEHCRPAFEKFCGLIGSIVDALKSAYETQFKPLFDWIVQNVVPILVPIIETIADSVMDAVGFIMDTLGNVFDYLSGIIDFVTGVFSGDWGKAWSGIEKTTGAVLNQLKDTFQFVFGRIWSVIKTPINVIIGGIESLVNGVISGINAMTSALNNISFDAPGIGQVGFDIPQIKKATLPRLAQGGYVKANTPQLAMIGDNRHQGEVVAPEDKLLEMAKLAASTSSSLDTTRLEEVLRAILTLLRTLPLYQLDDESLRQYFIRKTNRETLANNGDCALIT